MEVTDSTRILLDRIQKLEPEKATKIIGYLLLKHTNQEIMEYAVWNDKQILSLINEAKTYLSSSPNFCSLIPQVRYDRWFQDMPFSPTVSQPSFSPLSFHVPAPFWDASSAVDEISLNHNLEFTHSSYVDLIGGLHKQADYPTLEEWSSSLNSIDHGFTNNCYIEEASFAGEIGSRTMLRSHPGWVDSPSKACHYYYKGFCKNGVNCRFFHGLEINDDSSNMYNSYENDICGDDIPFSPGSVENLEMEIIELLKSKEGMPVSIASLPMMYLERYGKVLQADGYLTESQRHGKSGFSLTRLLGKYHSLRLIDRPHGQHSVVLVEDVPKFLYCMKERNDQGAMLASSHQIYLTFPSESTFMEDDLYNYFNQYGPVRDVRIPRQERRMFGFVSFLYPETVKLILSMGHPHYICGARVLVKPYKEKSKLTEKKYIENVDSPVFHPSQYLEVNQNPNTMFNMNDNSTFLKSQQIDDLDLAIELERRRLFDLQLIPKKKTPQPFINIVTDNLEFPEDDFNIFSAVSNNDSKSDILGMQASDNRNHQHSDHIELPDSPFASPRLGNNISGTI